MKIYDFVVIGGGVFGVTTALELAKRKHTVALLNPDSIPHHLAASTDISKAVRMEYGTDWEYARMAEESIEGWKHWNTLFNDTLYHEVGFLMLCRQPISSQVQQFERSSYDNLTKAGFNSEILDSEQIGDRFPAFMKDQFSNACFNKHGGYVESGRAIEVLANYAFRKGVEIFEEQTAVEFVIENGRLNAVKTGEGMTFHCGHAIVAAGSGTPKLVPDLAAYMKVTGHPVFWLKPQNPTFFLAESLPVFTADISNTGWYGFPFSPKQGIVKIAKHTNGLKIDPVNDDRRVNDNEVVEMREFVGKYMPGLANAPLVYTRRCLYTDTLDGHFWIDHHPGIAGLSVSSGGSGHGMKMAPVLGIMTADMAEGRESKYSDRYKWRHLDPETLQKEEARFVEKRQL